MSSKLRLNKSSMTSKNKNEKGIVLVGTIALTALLALFGTLGIVTTSTELIISKNYKSSVQARYVAEAGIHRTIGMLNSGSGWIEGINPAINAFAGDNSFGNGTYDVNVYENDPTAGKVRIVTTGNVNGSSSTFEAIVCPRSFKIFDYANFDCGNVTLKVGPANKIIGNVFIGANPNINGADGTLDMEDSGVQIIEGNVQAEKDIVIKGGSYITGDANANGNIDLESSVDPNITGTATAGVAVSGPGNAGDKIVTANTVPDLCSGEYLTDNAITSEDIQDYREAAAKADNTITGNYEYASTNDFVDVVHITEDFELTENSTFSKDLVFIVDGNVDISAELRSTNDSFVTFLVPSGNFKVKGGAIVEIDGNVYVGSVNVDVDEDGEIVFVSVSGGDLKVTENSILIVNGSVVVVDGDTDASSGGTFLIDRQSGNGDSITKPNSYAMMQWREIIN